MKITIWKDGLIYFGAKDKGSITYDSFTGIISDVRFYPTLSYPTNILFGAELCPAHYFSTDNGVTCLECNLNCETCAETLTKCLSCKEDWFYYENKCYETCPSDTKSLRQGKVCIADDCPDSFFISLFLFIFQNISHKLEQNVFIVVKY